MKNQPGDGSIVLTAIVAILVIVALGVVVVALLALSGIRSIAGLDVLRAVVQSGVSVLRKQLGR